MASIYGQGSVLDQETRNFIAKERTELVGRILQGVDIACLAHREF